jgi:hypothetical protein
MIRRTITAATTQPEAPRLGAAGAACGFGVAAEALVAPGVLESDGAGLPVAGAVPGEVAPEPAPLAPNPLGPSPLTPVPPGAAGALAAPPADPDRSAGGGTGVRNSSGSRPDGVE